MDRAEPRRCEGPQTGRETAFAGSAGLRYSGAGRAESAGDGAGADGEWSDGAWRLAWAGVEIRERRRWAREWSTS